MMPGPRDMERPAERVIPRAILSDDEWNWLRTVLTALNERLPTCRAQIVILPRKGDAP